MHEQHGKIDFHLHSYASNVTGYYAANALAIPESYSDPRKLYALLKKRGMSLVTLTDHNSIDGVKELLDLGKRDVFASAEMTTTFPKDGCNIHVTVANVTEAQFREVDRLRGNVFEMVAYLDQEIAAQAWRPGGNEIAYFMTHPLMSTQNRPHGREGALTVDHLEQALLLFEAFEVQNGARTKALNELTRRLLESLDRETIERLADKHGIAPKGDTPWRKAMVAGSDDHAGINPGNTWTVFPAPAGRAAPSDAIRAIRTRRTRPGGAHGGPITLAHSLLKLLYDGSARAKQTRTLSVGGPIHGLFQMVFDEDRMRTHERLIFRAGRCCAAGCGSTCTRSAAESSRSRACSSPRCCSWSQTPQFTRALGQIEKTDDRIFLVLNTLLNRIFTRYVDGLKNAQGRNIVFIIKQLVTMVSSNLFVSLPYLMSFAQQSSDSLVAHDVRKRFGLGQRPRVVLLTDTLFEINGVAASIKRMIREAIRRDKDFTVVTCLAAREQARYTADPEIAGWLASGRLKLFEPVAQLDFPEYNDFQIRLPPLLELMKYLQEEGFTRCRSARPGSSGSPGLAAAKALQIETAATYHTSVPEYVENYTKDVALEALAWQYMILFYHSVDEVLVAEQVHRAPAPQARAAQPQAVDPRSLGRHRPLPPRQAPGRVLCEAPRARRRRRAGQVRLRRPRRGREEPPPGRPGVSPVARDPPELPPDHRRRRPVPGPARGRARRRARDVHRHARGRAAPDRDRVGRREAVPEHDRHLGQRAARGPGLGPAGRGVQRPAGRWSSWRTA